MSGQDRILDAAESLFAERGVDGVSIRQIAESAGLSKATVFHHFENKEALYQAVVRRCAEGTGNFLAQLAGNENGDPLASLDEYRQRDLNEMLEKADLVRLILRELTSGSDEQSRQMAEKVFGEHFINLKRLIERAHDKETVRGEVDAGVAAISVFSINVFLFLTWPVLKHLPDTKISDIDQVSRAMFELLMNGMRQSGGAV